MSNTTSIPRICNPEHRAAFLKMVNETYEEAIHHLRAGLTEADTYEKDGKISDIEWRLFMSGHANMGRDFGGNTLYSNLTKQVAYHIRRQKLIEQTTGEVGQGCGCHTK